jgi:hypothetical protein
VARTCESCGRYLGARTDCLCGWSASTGIDEPGFADAPDLEAAEPPRAAVPSVSAPFWAGVRGVVTDGRPIRVRSAGGVLLARLVVLAAVIVVVVLYWQKIVDAVTNALLAFFLAQLLPILIVVVVIALVARFLPAAGGCLLLPLRLLSLGAIGGLGRSPKAEDGWDIVLETERGEVAVRIAADIPLDGGEEIVVHGPAYGGRKHAWLVQGIQPAFVRIGRGIVPLALATVLVAIGLTLLILRLSAAP